MQESGEARKFCESLASGYDMTDIHVYSQEQWLPAQDIHNIKRSA